jgi:hypothetical protein
VIIRKGEILQSDVIENDDDGEDDNGVTPSETLSKTDGNTYHHRYCTALEHKSTALFYFIYLFIVIWRPLGHVTQNYLTVGPHLAPVTPPCPRGGHCPNVVPLVIANLVRAPEDVRAFRLTLLYARRLRSPL